MHTHKDHPGDPAHAHVDGHMHHAHDHSVVGDGDRIPWQGIRYDASSEVFANEVDAYAYDHGAAFHEAFGRTDDGYEEVES